MSKALEDVRVLDMTHVQSGPSTTQILAWLGADVIKLEAPGHGDITRSQLRDLPDVDSLYFTMLNSNKRSITLNMKSDQGKEIFTDLVSRVDVLVENFGPGVVDRFGFPWERLQEINPRLIYASIKGFGPGRYANFKAYEVIAQAMGGSMSTTGFEEGPRPPPARRSATPVPGFTWWPASSPRSISAPVPAAGSASTSPCRTPCSTCAG